MAKKHENEKGFLIIEGTAADFLSIGCGLSKVTFKQIVGGALDGIDVVDYGGGEKLWCDWSGEDIAKDETCYYIAVLNSIFNEQSFKKWYWQAVVYAEDKKVEERNYSFYRELLVNAKLMEGE